VKEFGAYADDCARPVLPMLAANGAEVRVATSDARALEGDRPGNGTIVVRFPSAARAETWYASAQFQPLRALRMQKLATAGDVAPAFDPAAFG
jgi:uncharacterized protein (DUF1330 family)